MTSINPSIFKAYDIRGKYPADLNEKSAEAIGRATADFLSKKYKKRNLSIIIGGDVRLSTPALKESIAKGLMLQGVKVMDAGIGTTPYFYFLISHLRPDGGVIITASHNPKDYNGLKIRDKECNAISADSGLKKIKEMATKGQFRKVAKPGVLAKAPDCEEEYFKMVSQGIKLKNEVQAVIDASGGSACLILPRILAKFPQVSYKPLFFSADGSFSKHSPNPLLAESQTFAIKELQKGKYRFGVVFDGDGDRIVFFDEKGNPLKAELIFGLFAEQKIKEGYRGYFVLPANTSKGVRDFIKNSGAKVKLTKIGYTFVQKAMRDFKAAFGVEVSAHFYFQDAFYKDSGAMTLLRLIQVLSLNPRPLSQLVKTFDTYISSGELNFEVEDKKAVLKRAKKTYSKAKISELDGVSIEFPDWWFNLRPSNTEPVIRLCLEAKKPELFKKKLAEVKGLIY